VKRIQIKGRRPLQTRPKRSRVNFYLLSLLLAAALLRFHALSADIRFHPDEALFTTFARNIWTQGDWSLQGDLDKPPLTIYANALSLAFVAATYNRGVPDFDARVGEFAARLPSVLASLIQIAAVYALSKRLYGISIARWAALFFALSPLAIAYSPGAYTDGVMLMFTSLALLMSAAHRPLWAGLWLALAFASKQQALYVVPLCLLLLFIQNNALTITRHHQEENLLPSSNSGRDKSFSLSVYQGWRQLLRFMLPLILVYIALLLWDSARFPSPSIFALAAANNTPTGLITPDQLAPRLIDWLIYLQAILGAPTILLLFFVPIATIWRVIRQRDARETDYDTLLFAFIVVYLLAHWLIAFNIYERYLLPILPLVAIMAARTCAWLWAMLRRAITQPEMTVAAGALVLSLISSAINASSGDTPYNSERVQYAGIIALADTLNDLPTATVIYDHWLGWELGYYLGGWHDKRRVYYPTPDALVRDALILPESDPRYFVAPSSVDARAWLSALESAGFTTERVYAAQSYVVYRLTPP